MPKIKIKNGNMKLAGLFVFIVLGLIFLSVFFKFIFLIKDINFDGSHKFNVAIIANEKINIVSFSPVGRSITLVSIRENMDKDNLSSDLGVLIDGIIITKNNLNKKNINSTLLKSVFPFGNIRKNLNSIDLIKLLFFSRSVSTNSIYEREISSEFNLAQKSTIISLSFTDPSIYQENQSIEIINATDTLGLGGKLANFITNIGGSVILVSSDAKKNLSSKIIYYGQVSYTVKKLSNYLNFPLEKSKTRNIADVIIIIGNDKIAKRNF